MFALMRNQLNAAAEICKWYCVYLVARLATVGNVTHSKSQERNSSRFALIIVREICGQVSVGRDRVLLFQVKRTRHRGRGR